MLSGDEDLCKRMTGNNFIFLNFLWSFDGVIDGPEVDSTRISVCLTANMFCINLQSLFLQGVNFETCSQNVEIRDSGACGIRKLLLPCESSLGKGGIVHRQKLV